MVQLPSKSLRHMCTFDSGSAAATTTTTIPLLLIEFTSSDWERSLPTQSSGSRTTYIAGTRTLSQSSPSTISHIKSNPKDQQTEECWWQVDKGIQVLPSDISNVCLLCQILNLARRHWPHQGSTQPCSESTDDERLEQGHSFRRSHQSSKITVIPPLWKEEFFKGKKNIIVTLQFRMAWEKENIPQWHQKTGILTSLTPFLSLTWLLPE